MTKIEAFQSNYTGFKKNHRAPSFIRQSFNINKGDFKSWISRGEQGRSPHRNSSINRYFRPQSNGHRENGINHWSGRDSITPPMEEERGNYPFHEEDSPDSNEWSDTEHPYQEGDESNSQEESECSDSYEGEEEERE